MPRINGNTRGISNILLGEIDALNGYRMGKDQFFSREMAEEMARLTAATGREISVLIERNGS